MKQKTAKRTASAAGVALALGLTLSSAPLPAASARWQQAPTSATPAVAEDSPLVVGFQERVKDYVKEREALEEKMMKLPKDATPEQIETHKAAFQGIVRAARAGAKPGQIFTAPVARHVRAVIRAEFKGKDRLELRKTVAEAETQGVPLRVNYPYPESKELVEMPPTLLLRLPSLPKQVKYRFVGRNLLLVDRENALIIDYMTNALP